MTLEGKSFETVVVTGCAGFLGSHLTDRFIDAGAQVVGIDNLMCGSLSNLEGALASGRFEFRNADVIEPYGADCEIVLNMACAASPTRYQADPLHTMQTSVLGAMNAAAVGLRNNARVLQASTSEIYGDPEIHPQHEGYRGAVNPIGPRACYDEGKRAAETILFDHNRTNGLDIAVVRIFNTYGPRMDPFDGRVVSNFIRQALMGESLTVFGKGDQTRSFCYVDDLIEGIWRLAHAGPGMTGPVNIGNPVELTILELAETVAELIDRPVTLEFRDLPVDDPVRRRPVIDEAERKLDWRPSVPLREGLVRTIDYFENIISSGLIDKYAETERSRFGTKAA